MTPMYVDPAHVFVLAVDPEGGTRVVFKEGFNVTVAEKVGEVYDKVDKTSRLGLADE